MLAGFEKKIEGLLRERFDSLLKISRFNSLLKS